MTSLSSLFWVFFFAKTERYWGTLLSKSLSCGCCLSSGVCPEGMAYMTLADCEAQGGACPRVCLDMTSLEVQCATVCYDGCYCAPGFYLFNSSCVPLAQCPCYHMGEVYPAETTLSVDACNNWYVVTHKSNSNPTKNVGSTLNLLS